MATWTLIHTARDRHEAELVRGLLECHDIEVMIMDGRSSVHPFIGATQVLVDRDDVIRAVHLMARNNDA